MDEHARLKRYAIVIVASAGLLGSTVSHSNAQGGYSISTPWSRLQNEHPQVAPPPVTDSYNSSSGYGTYYHNDPNSRGSTRSYNSSNTYGATPYVPSFGPQHQGDVSNGPIDSGVMNQYKTWNSSHEQKPNGVITPMPQGLLSSPPRTVQQYNPPSNLRPTVRKNY